MKKIDPNIIRYENIYQSEFLVKSFYWYKNIGYSYLKNTERINFPVLTWYQYFSHLNQFWLLIGAYIEIVDNIKSLEWIFYIPDTNDESKWRYFNISYDFHPYFTKIKNDEVFIDISKTNPINLYNFTKIKNYHFPHSF